MRMLKIEAIALASFGFFCLSACGGSDGSGASSTTTSTSTTPPAAAAPAAAPTVTLTSSSAKVIAGASVTLTWSATNASSCVASGAWSGTQVTAGTLTTALGTAGSSTFTLSCSGSGGSAAASTTVTVAAIPAATFTSSPTSLTFGSQITGTASAAQAVTLTYTGTTALTNVVVSVSGDFAESTTCASSFAAAATCTVNVTFKPTTTGNRTGTLTIASSFSGGSVAVALNGTGAAAVASTPVAVVSPTSLSFASQAVGSRSTTQVVSLKNTGNTSLTNIAVSISGDFSETNTCGTSLAAAASCAITVSFSPTAAAQRTGALQIASNYSGSPSTVPLSGSGVTTNVTGAMTLISRGLPIYASSAQYPATDANDADYNTAWRSVGVPATLALDLSSVPSAQRKQIWLVWYNDNTYGYDHVLIGQPGYNNPGTYTLEANAAAGGGTPPTSGWVQLESLAGNTLDSYSYLLNFTGYNWVRLNFIASDGSIGNTDIAINLDIYSAPNGVTDGWFFNGDSITANCMRHTDVDGADANNPGTDVTLAAPSFGQQVSALTGNDMPEQEDGGIPEFKSGDMLPYLSAWLAHIPSKYVTINLGTNDAAGIPAATYSANMETLALAVIAAGKTPIIPTIPFSVDATHQANEPSLNAKLQALYAAYPAIVPGPDLFSYFKAHPQYLSADGVHPNAQGCVAYRALWAQFAVSTIYH
jgi:lysophospholipase L1-like esterase